MKWLFKWLLRLVFVAVVLVVVLYFAKDLILRVVAENRIRSQTGMEAQIGKFSSGRTGSATYVTLENLKLYNPAGFGGGVFLDIPELHLECDTVAFAQRRLRITEARLNLAELDIVKNAAGQTNLFALQRSLGVDGPKKGGPAGLNGFEFQGIDRLILSLGRAKFLDLKDAKNNREIRVDLEKQVFSNVKSEADVYGIVFMLWLRSGGNFSLAPVVPATSVPAAGIPAAPPKK